MVRLPPVRLPRARRVQSTVLPDIRSCSRNNHRILNTGRGVWCTANWGYRIGHFGDKVGRKKIFMVTLLLMGASTIGIGLPTYETIGVWAPILLVTLRFIQGIGVGGETGAGTLLTLETAPDNRRGLYGSIVMATASVGVILSVGSVALLSLMPRDDLLSWGWRMPFLGSVILVVIGAYIRRRITESPFREKTTD
nr:MFS transporter [Arthrobacter dokdonellae]